MESFVYYECQKNILNIDSQMYQYIPVQTVVYMSELVIIQILI